MTEGRSQDVRLCRRCHCTWAQELGDIPCWQCADIDSVVVYDDWTSRQIIGVHPLDPLPGDSDDPVFSPPGHCYVNLSESATAAAA